MQIRYFREYSHYLDRFMEFKMYGHAGKMCFVFPCQDGRFFEWEDRGMFSLVQDLIDQGRIQFCTVDSIDKETWSSFEDTHHRMWLQECWVRYVMEELVPSALDKAGLLQDSKCMTLGASMGGTHAANFFFRFPDRFDKVLGISGVYDMNEYFHGVYDDNCYNNDPCAYLAGMDPNHPFIEKYNQSQIILTVGQGAWEDVCKNSLRKLADILYEKNIHAWIDFWGYDVNHDWPWWEVMLKYFLPKMV
ncbi:alpha/beta hydrolase-fold protein [uncultured Faecalicoccus sp.]|uniref:esterase family protein n=1 Tax=uncultured Faecalicoccus sp. TaxID=1971760 RepID=UPI002602A991|nr:alpha/beta hydrolase-fold protein [uncultured Faecalicoccus sp.]